MVTRRKREQGNGETAEVIELTKTALAIVGSAITIVTFFVGITAAVVTSRAQLQSATPMTRHDSLLKVVAHQDTTISELKADLLGINCMTSGYPMPFCRNVPRVIQAGMGARP